VDEERITPGYWLGSALDRGRKEARPLPLGLGDWCKEATPVPLGLGEW